MVSTYKPTYTAEQVEQMEHNAINDFLWKISPFGYADMQKALKFLSGAYHINSTADKLADLFHESLESEFFTDYDSVDFAI